MKIIVTGATGLVGGEALRQALTWPGVTEVVSLGRRTCGIDDPKLTDVVHDDFSDLRAVADHFCGVDLCVYCLAAYSYRMSRAQYATITVEYLRAFLDVICEISPDAAFSYFSAEGAQLNGRSWMHTLNVKGRAETLVLESPLPRRYVFRPGYINPTSPRENPMLMDMLAAPFFRVLPSIGVESADLARVMIETGLADMRETAVLGNADIRDATAIPQ